MSRQTRKTQRLLEIAKEMIRRENELALLRQEFDRLARSTGDGGEGAIGPTVERPAPRPPLARTSSFPHRIQSLLDMRGVPLTVVDIATGLDEPESIDTIRATLSKLIYRGDVKRVAQGVYQSTRTGGHGRAAGEDD